MLWEIFGDEEHEVGSCSHREQRIRIKNPPAMRETWVRSLGWEDPLEKGMAAHSSILAWRIPLDRGAWQAPWSLKESD